MSEQRALAITGGRVWDGTGAAPVEGATVLIEGDRIAALGPDVEAPPGVEQIDARGRFVMPGLIDMHVHVQLCGDDSLYAWLGTGITTVRDLGGSLDALLPLREALASGERIGPRLFTYGQLLDGDPPIFGANPAAGIGGIARPTKTVEEAVAAVEEQIARGADGIKLYAGLRPDMVSAMIRAVDGRVPVTGHLGRTWASEAIELGIDCLEHVHATAYQDVVRPEDRHTREGGNGAMPNYWSWLTEGWSRADLDADYVATFIELLVTYRVALSPTTVLITAGMATTDAAEEPGQRYRPKFMADRTRERMEAMARMREEAVAAGREVPPPPAPVDPDVGARARANEVEFLRRAHAAGGIVVPSTDVGAAPQQVPGFSLHRELAMLVEGGISTSDVLQGATRVAAEVLRHNGDLGTLERGKRADVLVIEGDPLTDIHDTRNVRTVVKDGVVHDPQALLDRIEV